uniref:Kri1-like C-terminal domain-containing protein n=1 Tax=Paramoeba aestuarina TaxID=180227 RepID=A0A7S4PCL7_9EUKA
MREEKNRRKKHRQLKQAQHEEQRRKEQEEIDRLKTLQREGVNRRINVIAKVSGSDRIKDLIPQNFLTSDFNEKDWDKQMERIFNEAFYSSKDSDGDEALDADHSDSWMMTERHKMSSDADHRLESELSKLQSEIKELHGPTEVADIPNEKKFRYTDVPSEDIPLSTSDILRWDDRTLNDIAPLRWYAPYVTEKERRKFKYVSLANKKRVQASANSEKTFKSSKKYRQDSSNTVE